MAKEKKSSVANILLGVLMIIGATFVLASPATATVAICWCLCAAMLIGGIAGIIRYIEEKNAEKVAAKIGLPYLASGVGSLILAIVAVVLAILVMTSEERAAGFMKAITVVFGLWIVMDGISFFKAGLAIKKLGLPGWLPGLIMSILVILSGILCIVNSFVGIATVGSFYGVSMMMFGFMLLTAKQ